MSFIYRGNIAILKGRITSPVKKDGKENGRLLCPLLRESLPLVYKK